MILVNNNCKNGHFGYVGSICYWTVSRILYRGAMKTRITARLPICLWLSLPVLTMTMSTLTTLMQTTCQLPNGWGRTKHSDGYTAKPAAHVSANDKANLCNIRSYQQPMLHLLPNVSAIAVVLKQPQNSSKTVLLPASLRLDPSNTVEICVALDSHKEWTMELVQIKT